MQAGIARSGFSEFMQSVWSSAAAGLQNARTASRASTELLGQLDIERKLRVVITKFSRPARSEAVIRRAALKLETYAKTSSPKGNTDDVLAWIDSLGSYVRLERTV